MNIEDIDRVETLRNFRDKAMRLREDAPCRMIECTLGGKGGLDVFSVIEATSIRAAIIATCNEKIQKYEAELTALGVTFESYLPSVDPRAEG